MGKQQADVCMLVEGAYPYVTGGMSSWLHALVSNLKELKFAIVHVGAQPEPGRERRYKLPENVVEYSEIYLNDPRETARRHKSRKEMREEKVWRDLLTLHETLALGKPFDGKILLPLRDAGFAGLTRADIFDTHEGWDLLVRLYQLYAPREAFTDFFWTFRFTYASIFSVLEADLPKASVYHAVSTGFCGLLGALARIRHGLPLLITEHGLYTREREIEISQALWLTRLAPVDTHSRQRMSFFQQWWLNIYRFMERITYECADSVIAITGVNQQYQLRHGADQRKLRIIPNGIDVNRMLGVRQLRSSGDTAEEQKKFCVGFVGRIVPIKDVKTFLRAIDIARRDIDQLEVYLVGPTDEDLLYFEECQRLVDLLDLSTVIHFTGQADVLKYYSMIDVVVLTSLSEGQPLVILEANCAGIPVVATDVGACRELLQGVSPEDRVLGASGLITPVASPHETAEALVRLWRSETMRLRLGRTGQERVQRFYHQDQLYQSYNDLYRSYMGVKV
jgi:glycosyltransferase involved in cell wall biosynthesis